ncbi:MAG: carboxypeptidase-like regulatory domain-containing protein [Gemmatimonadaceae bacterium]
MTLRRTLVLALVLVVSAAADAPAQRVTGIVRDSITDTPVSGAVVWLSDSTGASVARSIADASGSFSVIHARGAMRMHVVRIGYRPHDAPLPTVDAGVVIRLEAIPAFLTAVEASDRRMCPGDRGSVKGFELWEQARAALLASVVSREAHPPRIRLISFTRTRDPVFNKVRKEETSMKELLVERSYVAARPAWAFAYQGYMREEGAGDRVYYAPDNETLLDPSFAGTHCLQMARNDRRHPDQVGIAFEPVDDSGRDTLVDVSGVLWLDRKTPALRSLEFRYTNLEPEARESGGEIFFRVMPNGASMIERWLIRTTLIAVDVDSRANGPSRLPLPRPLRRNVRKIGMHEVGGEVASVQWKDGSLWHGALPRITGILTDGAGTPVAGARVWMMKTADTVTTTIDGRFELPYVTPGVYAVLATDSTFASSGLSRTSHYWVNLDREHVEDIKLVFHERAEILQQLCLGQSYAPGTGVVIGQVVGTGGLPAANAKIDVWRSIKSGNVELIRQEAGGAAGEDGRFVICGTPLDQQLRIRATDARESGEIIIDKWKDEVFVATLRVRGS